MCGYVQVEVWLKYTGAKGTVRRKLDLVAKCHPKKEIVDQDLLIAGGATSREKGKSIGTTQQNEETDQNDSTQGIAIASNILVFKKRIILIFASFISFF